MIPGTKPLSQECYEETAPVEFQLNAFRDAWRGAVPRTVPCRAAPDPV